MDSRVVQSHVHEQNEDLHSHDVGSQVAHGAENQHHHDHEKKSVLKKVKEKARRIKDTIKKHGHHDRDNEYHYEDQHIHHDPDLDEENDRQGGMVKDPEFYGAPMYDSATVKSTTAEQVENPGEGRVSTVMEEEYYQEPRIVVVSAATESDQNRGSEAARTFTGQEKSGQGLVNLERPIGLKEEPHAPGSRPEAYTPSNYEAKVTDPTEAGTGEIDITPVQESLARMKVEEEAKANSGPRVLPTTAETQYPSTRSHDQFSSDMSSATKTQYPSAGIHDQFASVPTPEIPNKFENLQAEPKALSSVADSRYPFDGSHAQFLPEKSIPTNSNKFPENVQAGPQVLPVATNDTQHLSTKSHHDHHDLSTNDHHDQFDPERLPPTSYETPKVLPTSADTQYPSVGCHDQFLPEVSPTTNETQYPPEFIPTKSHHDLSTNDHHDQFDPEPIPAISYETPKVLPTSADTQYPSVGSHDQFLPEVSTTTNETQYPPEFIPTNPSNYQKNPQVPGEIMSTNTRSVEQPLCESMEKPSKENSYEEKISSVTSAIPDQAISAKNDVACKLGYDEKGDRDKNETRYEEYGREEDQSNQSGYTETITDAISALPDKAVSAENVVAPKLGYDKKGDKDENEIRHEGFRSEEKPSNQSSYTQKLSSATSAIADKAVSAKNFVASEPGYGEEGHRDENETRQEEYTSEEKPSNGSSDKEKISSAASAIADKAVSAKDVVASKLGYDEKGHIDEYKSGEKPSNQSSYTGKNSSATSAISDKAVSAKNAVASELRYDEKGDREGNEAKNAVASELRYDETGDREGNEARHEEHTSEEKPLNQSSYPEIISATTSEIADEAISAKNAVPLVTASEYANKNSLSLTEELAPVYGKVGGPKSDGATNETQSRVVEQDKGASMKDYLAEKLRPGDEDRALKEVISDALYKQKEEVAKGKGTVVDEDRNVSEVVADAIHKQEEEPKKAELEQFDKVTEPKEVENKRSDESNVSSPRKGVVDKLKDVVGSWFGKPGDGQSS